VVAMELIKRIFSGGPIFLVRTAPDKTGVRFGAGQAGPFLAVEPHCFKIAREGRGRVGCTCRISGTGLPIPACLRQKIFFLGRAGIEDVAPQWR